MTTEMPAEEPIIVADVVALARRPSQQPVYDRPVELAALHEGAEHYVVRYPAGLVVSPHRHSAAQTILVIEGTLEVGGRTLGPGGYCRIPGGAVHHHAPAGGPCTFVTMFDGPFDVERD